MNKKILISVAPLIVSAAFALMPATSQAAPHVYKNGVIGAEGKKVREISWGTLLFENNTIGAIECHNIVAGYVENPTGGGATKGQVQGFYPYECVFPGCTALGGVKLEFTSGKLPWRVQVIEPEAGVFRQRTGFKGPEINKLPKEPEYVDFMVTCQGSTENIYKVEFFGERDPRLLNNGLSIGALPGEEEFTQGATGESELESETVGGGKTSGKVKLEGYGAEELIEVKNP